jgi:hypothetical protein
MVLQALKDRIYDDASNYPTRWLAELPHMIWGLSVDAKSALSANHTASRKAGFARAERE